MVAALAGGLRTVSGKVSSDPLRDIYFLLRHREQQTVAIKEGKGGVIVAAFDAKHLGGIRFRSV